MRRRGRRIAAGALAALALGGAIMLYGLGRPPALPADAALEGVDETLCAALYHASLAASSHNAQSWRVTLDPRARTLWVSLDEARRLEVVDPEGRELYLSAGCYVEALVTALDACGYDAAAENTYAADRPWEIARITYRRRDGAGIDEARLETLRRRHTDKRGYSSEPITPADAAWLLDGADGIACYAAGTAEFAFLQRGTVEAVTAQSADDAYRGELNQWLRFSNLEVEEKRDGISPEMLGLRGVVKALYLLTTGHGNAGGDRFAEQGIRTAEKQVEHCGAFFVVTGADNPAGWIEAGRRTQAFWYRCADRRVAIQPLSAMLEVAACREALERELTAGARAQMLLRAGYVEDYGENAAVRRSLRDYVTVIR